MFRVFIGSVLVICCYYSVNFDLSQSDHINWLLPRTVIKVCQMVSIVKLKMTSSVSNLKTGSLGSTLIGKQSICCSGVWASPPPQQSIDSLSSSGKEVKFRLTKRDDHFWVNLNHFKSSSIFGGSWGIIAKWLEPKTKPPLGNLACPNLWNALSLLDFHRNWVVWGDS